MEHTAIRLAPGWSLYTGLGHAPFEAGRELRLRSDHAAELIAAGVAHAPDAPAEARQAVGETGN